MWTIAALIAAQVTAPALPEWMAGCWEQESKGRSTVECWSMPEAPGNLMRGESIARASGKIVERETMLIVHEQTDDPAIPWMTFWAIPAGGKRTRFDWVPSDQPGLTFVNAEHDFPQRIRYWRDGRFLMAEISASDGSKARRWRFSPRGR